MRASRLKKLRNNPLFITGTGILSIAILVSLGGASIRPDNSPYANSQYLELAAMKPMSSVTFLKIPKREKIAGVSALKSYFVGKRSSFEMIPVDSIDIADESLCFRKYGQEQVQKIPLDKIYFGSDPDSERVMDGQNSVRANAALSEEGFMENYTERITSYFGRDKYGRDLLSRLMSASYISLSVGLISVLISLILGISLGLLAGYFGGWADRIIVWLINVVWSVPTLLLVIAITLVLGKGFWQIFIAVGLTMWVEVARIVRGQVLSLKEKEFVEAGLVLGLSNFRIITHHILPNVMSPVIVISAANFATAILLEAGLSFLGIGAPPPQATWGKMISEHKSYIITGDAHLAILPGIAIMLLVLSFTFIGNGLRDAYDERLVLRD